MPTFSVLYNKEMKIIWDKVTRLSQIVAIVLFVAVFGLAFQLGRSYEKWFIVGNPVNKVTFECADKKSIYAEFFKNFVHLEFAGKTVYLPQAISASGARYANSNESLVFWNKGDTAFMTEGDPNTPTYKDCVIKK